MDPKIDLFCQSCHPCFDHFGLKKVNFWTFSKLFESCSGVVRALFLDLKGPLLGVFQLKRFINDLEKRNFWSNFCRFWSFQGVIFDHFWDKKSDFWDFFKVVSESFRKYLGIVFGLKVPNFGCIYNSKGCQMTSKINIFCQNLAL